MWINKETVLPEAILTAERLNRLVVFVGAGVSMGSPANLPSFRGLVERIAAGRLELPKEQPLDRVLGRWQREGADVQALVRQELDVSTSLPTDLHRNLVGLFGRAERIRIVTTNFDRHLTTVASQQFGKDSIPIYVGPAVPLGRDVAGLVYLHGSLDNSRHPLVLTDADFGRAYLTDGWATRFLLELFQQYTVCFVGYSHTDPTMHYLARGLPPRTPRFAFTPKGDASKGGTDWGGLDIEPIYYPMRSGGDRHLALTEAIGDWGQRATMGFLDHERRIQELTSTAPPIERDLVDYLREMLKVKITQAFVLKYIKGKEWLAFLEEAKELAPLFKLDQGFNESLWPLAWWLAEHFMLEQPETLFGLLSKGEMQIGSEFWEALTRRLATAKPPASVELRFRWLSFLISAYRPWWSTHWLEEILQSLGEDEAASMLLLVSHLAIPVAKHRGRWFQSTQEFEVPTLSLEPVTRGNADSLREAWRTVMLPHLGTCNASLSTFLTESLLRAHLILRGAGTGDRQWDAITGGRSAIEHHEQDRHPDPMDVVIDMARDLLEFLLKDEEHHPAGVSLRSAWLQSEAPILRRLAVHGYTEEPAMSPSEVLGLILERGWLEDIVMRHEVFRLLARAYSEADEEARESFLDRALEKESESQPATDTEKAWSTNYEPYNLLVWLAQAAPHSKCTRDRLAKLQAANPTFQPHKHPDFGHWTGPVETVNPRSPKTPNELVASPANDQLQWLLTFEGTAPFEPEATSREGLLQSVQEAVGLNFSWSWDLAQALAAHQGDDRGLWAAVFRGWRARQLPHEDWERVLGFVQSNDALIQAEARSIVELLERGIEDESGTVDISLRKILVDIAERIILIPDSDDSLVMTHRPDWLAIAINHPAGKAMLVWLRALAKDRAEAAGAWQRIDESARARLENALLREGKSSDRARTIVGSQAHFLYGLDPDWWRVKVLPLFDWEKDVETAAKAWQGFLCWGRIFPALFEEMRPHFEKTFAHLGPSPHESDLGESRRRFCRLLAEIVTHFPTNQWTEPWLRRFVRDAPDDCRKMWADEISRILQELPPETTEALWKEGISKYWDSRMTGVPRPIEFKEGGAMAQWALGLRSVLPEVVNRIEKTPATLGDHTHFFQQLKESELATRFPGDVARLLRALLRAADRLTWQCDDIGEIFRTLLEANAESSILKEVCERLASLGCSCATKLGDLLKESGNDPTP